MRFSHLSCCRVFVGAARTSVLSIAGVPVVVEDRYQYGEENTSGIYVTNQIPFFSRASRVLKACHKYRTVFIFLLSLSSCALLAWARARFTPPLLTPRHIVAHRGHYCRVHCARTRNKAADNDVAIECALMRRESTRVAKITLKVLSSGAS